jgi:hypothetical protein
MRVLLIAFLALCLAEAVGSHITRVEFETAANLCNEHGGLDAVETMPSLTPSITHVTAHCHDGSKVLRKVEDAKP